MEGYFVNNTGKAIFFFKHHFSAGHKMSLNDIWKPCKKRVTAELDKEVVTEKEFVSWLKDNGYIRDGMVYHPGTGEPIYHDSQILEKTSAEVIDKGVYGDGRLSKPCLANMPPKVLQKLSYSDIADLRMSDDPKRILLYITNINKLRRAYTIVRSKSRKRHLEKLLRHRIHELEGRL